MLNSETGEMEYESQDVGSERRIYLDKETGEMSSCPMYEQGRRRSKFLIPKQYLRNQDGLIGRRPANAPKVNLASCSQMYRERQIQLKEEITVGCNRTSHLLFLVPLLFIMPKLAAVIITFVEVMLHIWAHRKTFGNRDPGVYYRSPLHIVSSQFCEICRHERFMGRVAKLQDERTKKMRNYFQKVARNMA